MIVYGMLGLGLILGVLIGYLLGSRRAAIGQSDGRLEQELRQQNVAKDAELAQARLELAASQRGEAHAQAEAAAIKDSLERERDRYKNDLAELREAFKALSADALKENSAELVRQADESFKGLQEKFKGDMAGREAAIKALLEPLNQQLITYQQRLQQTEGSQTLTLGEVKKQLELLTVTSGSLARETEQFRRVLHSNQARGRWGEETLRRVVEAAGMSPHCDFIEQAQEGESKPDMLVQLPGGRKILVDAKTPDLDFLDDLEQADVATRAKSLANHASKIRDMVNKLAARKYPASFPDAMDYVVMFLPSESLYSAALEADKNLLVWAGQQRILLATPATLIGLLRAISFSWQQSLQVENSQKILKEAQELYDRVAKFIGYIEVVGKGLTQALGPTTTPSAATKQGCFPADGAWRSWAWLWVRPSWTTSTQ